MKRALRKIRDFALWLDSPDDPEEATYDPVHLGAVLVVCLSLMGIFYWLLWTLLVYEGGLFTKVGPALALLVSSKTPLDFGYHGPYDRGIFEGWFGNISSFFLCLLMLGALHHLYFRASKNVRKK